MSELELPRNELEAAAGLPDDQRTALQVAAEEVRSYHQRQPLESWRYTEADGTMLGQKVTPLDRVGLYVPGGLASYPSSVLMERDSRQGCRCRGTHHGGADATRWRNPLVLAAAAITGVDRVFTIGGAQAVYRAGLWQPTVPRWTRSSDPAMPVAGCQSAACSAWSVRHGCRSVGGADHLGWFRQSPTGWRWISSPRPAHDELAQSILLCRQAFIEAVAASIENYCRRCPRRQTIQSSLANRGALVKVSSLEEACVIANRIAPEHLNCRWKMPSHWWSAFIMPARSLSATGRSRRWAITAPVPTMCCRPCAARAFVAAWRV